MVRVKICGIRRLEDALLCVEAGADALGFLVGQRHASRDFITPDLARKIINSLPPMVSSVLVTHVEEIGEVLKLLDAVPASTLQAHGEMTPTVLKEIRCLRPGLKIIKSIHVTGPQAIAALDVYAETVDAFLLDTSDPGTGAIGGTGRTHDWSISRKIVEHSQIPVILAGGLNQENVLRAIEKVDPFGVDVNSGTKGSDGFKDPAKVAAFIANARRAG